MVWSISSIYHGWETTSFEKRGKDFKEMLKLFGVPVLQSSGEAEALCAQLNREGLVDACITADSDAFLFGAKCVIKCFRSNTRVRPSSHVWHVAKSSFSIDI
ncbi:Flap endonuclease GEN-like 1-like protein [Drosera capensis]